LCQYNVFFVSSDVNDPTTRRLRKITRLSTLIQTLVYVSLGLCGYAIFGEETHDNIYTNFGQGNAAANVGRFLQCLALCVQTPLSVFGARANLINMLSCLCPTAIQESIVAEATPNVSRVGSLSVVSCGGSMDLYTVMGEDIVHVDCVFSRSRAGSAASCCSPARSRAGSATLRTPGFPSCRSSNARPKDLEAPLISHKASEAEAGTAAEQPGATSAGTWFLHIFATAWICLGSMVLAFLVPSVSFLTGKLGGFSGTLQMYVFPGMVLLTCPNLRPPFQRVLILSGFALAWLTGMTALLL
jgi:amino acid permease